jgi:hypothetical protein
MVYRHTHTHTANRPGHTHTHTHMINRHTHTRTHTRLTGLVNARELNGVRATVLSLPYTDSVTDTDTDTDVAWGLGGPREEQHEASLRSECLSKSEGSRRSERDDRCFVETDSGRRVKVKVSALTVTRSLLTLEVSALTLTRSLLTLTRSLLTLTRSLLTLTRSLLILTRSQLCNTTPP